MVRAMKQQRTLAEKWLWLGVTALALAGIFAVILVVARTPQLAALTVFQQLFSVALVIHVDLSVLMWFLAMLGMGCALLMEKYPAAWLYWPKAAWCTIAAATAAMALAPLEMHWEVIKSNYIPMLGGNSLFLLALGLLAAGLGVLVVPVIVTYASVTRQRMLDLVEMGWFLAAIVVALALAAFFLSARALPGALPQVPYETLFWAGGHMLQFAFSLLMMAAWLALLQAMGAAWPSRQWALLAYGITLAGALASFADFVLHPFNTSEFVEYQTRVMIDFGGLGAALLAVMVVGRLIQMAQPVRPVRAYISTLMMSLTLFAAGGALGLMISGQNVTIPAHYHGEIVGITLALMGLAYSMLPRLGYESVAATRLAFWQPIVYGVGQLMHIGGLGYSGGYGVLRKTPGELANSLTPDVKIAMGVMGMGGLLAIIGGLLFVVVMLRARRAAQ
jgi:cytochrome c oxidase subunit 1